MNNDFLNDIIRNNEDNIENVKNDFHNGILDKNIFDVNIETLNGSTAYQEDNIDYQFKIGDQYHPYMDDTLSYFSFFNNNFDFIFNPEIEYHLFEGINKEAYEFDNDNDFVFNVFFSQNNNIPKLMYLGDNYSIEMDNNHSLNNNDMHNYEDPSRDGFNGNDPSKNLLLDNRINFLSLDNEFRYNYNTKNWDNRNFGVGYIYGRDGSTSNISNVKIQNKNYYFPINEDDLVISSVQSEFGTNINIQFNENMDTIFSKYLFKVFINGKSYNDITINNRNINIFISNNDLDIDARHITVVGYIPTNGFSKSFSIINFDYLNPQYNVPPFISYNSMNNTFEDININLRFDVSTYVDGESTNIIENVENLSPDNLDNGNLKVNSNVIYMYEGADYFLEFENISTDYIYVINKSIIDSLKTYGIDRAVVVNSNHEEINPEPRDGIIPQTFFKINPEEKLIIKLTSKFIKDVNGSETITNITQRLIFKFIRFQALIIDNEYQLGTMYGEVVENFKVIINKVIEEEDSYLKVSATNINLGKNNSTAVTFEIPDNLKEDGYVFEGSLEDSGSYSYKITTDISSSVLEYSFPSFTNDGYIANLTITTADENSFPINGAVVNMNAAFKLVKPNTNEYINVGRNIKITLTPDNATEASVNSEATGYTIYYDPYITITNNNLTLYVKDVNDGIERSTGFFTISNNSTESNDNYYISDIVINSDDNLISVDAPDGNIINNRYLIEPNDLLTVFVSTLENVDYNLSIPKKINISFKVNFGNDYSEYFITVFLVNEYAPGSNEDNENNKTKYTRVIKNIIDPLIESREFTFFKTGYEPKTLTWYSITPEDFIDIEFYESGVDISYLSLVNSLPDDNNDRYNITVRCRTTFTDGSIETTDQVINNYYASNSNEYKPRLDRYNGSLYYILNINNKYDTLFEYRILVNNEEIKEYSVICNDIPEVKKYTVKLYSKRKGIIGGNWNEEDKIVFRIDSENPIKPLFKEGIENNGKYKYDSNFINNFKNENILSHNNITIERQFDNVYWFNETEDKKTYMDISNENLGLLNKTDSFVIKNTSDTPILVYFTISRPSDISIETKDILFNNIIKNKNGRTDYIIESKGSATFIVNHLNDTNFEENNLITVYSRRTIDDEDSEFSWTRYEKGGISYLESAMTINFSSLIYLTDYDFTGQYYLNDINNNIDIVNFNKPYLYNTEIYVDNVKIELNDETLNTDAENIFKQNGNHVITLITRKFNGLINYSNYLVTMINDYIVPVVNTNSLEVVKDLSTFYSNVNQRNVIIPFNESNNDIRFENELQVSSKGNISLILKDSDENNFSYKLTRIIENYLNYTNYFIDQEYSIYENIKQQTTALRNFTKTEFNTYYNLYTRSNEAGIEDSIENLINNIINEFNKLSKQVVEFKDKLEEFKENQNNTNEVKEVKNTKYLDGKSSDTILLSKEKIHLFQNKSLSPNDNVNNHTKFYDDETLIIKNLSSETKTFYFNNLSNPEALNVSELQYVYNEDGTRYSNIPLSIRIEYVYLGDGAIILSWGYKAGNIYANEKIELKENSYISVNFVVPINFPATSKTKYIRLPIKKSKNSDSFIKIPIVIEDIHNSIIISKNDHTIHGDVSTDTIFFDGSEYKKPLIECQGHFTPESFDIINNSQVDMYVTLYTNSEELLTLLADRKWAMIYIKNAEFENFKFIGTDGNEYTLKLDGSSYSITDSTIVLKLDGSSYSVTDGTIVDSITKITGKEEYIKNYAEKILGVEAKCILLEFSSDNLKTLKNQTNEEKIPFLKIRVKANSTATVFLKIRTNKFYNSDVLGHIEPMANALVTMRINNRFDFFEPIISTVLSKDFYFRLNYIPRYYISKMMKEKNQIVNDYFFTNSIAFKEFYFIVENDTNNSVEAELSYSDEISVSDGNESIFKTLYYSFPDNNYKKFKLYKNKLNFCFESIKYSENNNSQDMISFRFYTEGLTDKTFINDRFIYNNEITNDTSKLFNIIFTNENSFPLVAFQYDYITIENNTFSSSVFYLFDEDLVRINLEFAENPLYSIQMNENNNLKLLSIMKNTYLEIERPIQNEELYYSYTMTQQILPVAYNDTIHTSGTFNGSLYVTDKPFLETRANEEFNSNDIINFNDSFDFFIKEEPDLHEDFLTIDELLNNMKNTLYDAYLVAGKVQRNKYNIERCNKNLENKMSVSQFRNWVSDWTNQIMKLDYSLNEFLTTVYVNSNKNVYPCPENIQTILNNRINIEAPLDEDVYMRMIRYSIKGYPMTLVRGETISDGTVKKRFSFDNTASKNSLTEKELFDHYSYSLPNNEHVENIKEGLAKHTLEYNNFISTLANNRLIRLDQSMYNCFNYYLINSVCKENSSEYTNKTTFDRLNKAKHDNASFLANCHF